MVLELAELKDFPNHSPVVGDFYMLKQCAIMGCGSGE
jgi:hypothetical protein